MGNESSSEDMTGPVLAMYDVTGIQSYIFKTPKMKDAIGASAIIEDIIQDALCDAVSDLDKCKTCDVEKISRDLEWKTEEGIRHFDDKNVKDVKVVYIGGGNGFVIYKDKETAVEVSKKMAKYVLDSTYSLQLAVAIVKKTDNYSEDYTDVMNKMTDIKAKMKKSSPIGAFPIVKTEYSTGCPIKEEGLSAESILKRNKASEKRKGIDKEYNKIDSYVEKKGSDSMLAVVHIDGNNMGLRIRALMEGDKNSKENQTYDKAVNRIRRISFNISNSYKKVFDDMKDYFDSLLEGNSQNQLFKEKRVRDAFVMKIITAGDDITYICNARIALATVEYFSKKISEKGLIDGCKPEELKEMCVENERDYKFSVCGGVAYFNSHFPFNIAYDVAESCCESAKKRAKKEDNEDEFHRIRNWVDYQFCRSVQSRDLSEERRKRYRSPDGKSLLKRPYCIPTDAETEQDYKEICTMINYDVFCKDMEDYVLEKSGSVPRSHVKKLRDCYSMGKIQVDKFCAFLDSRGIEMPKDMYQAITEGEEVAHLYDALEVADEFLSYKEIEDIKVANGKADNEKGGETGNDEN